MSLKVFSPCLFAPEGIHADIEGRVVSGGTSLSGQEDVIATDGGGRWFFELTNPYLDGRRVAKAWRALSAHLGAGQPIIVRICDTRHQPTNGFEQVPHSDGAPFSDGGLYLSGDCDIVTAADAALRSTSLAIDIVTLPEPLVGGERFSIVHDTMLDRIYEISEISEDRTTVFFTPPLREAVPAGTELNFEDPRCVMRRDGDMRSPTTMGYAESPGVRFVEHFPGPGGY